MSMAYPRAPYASLSRVGCTFSELSRRDASMDRSRLGVAALTGAVFGNLVGYLAYKLNDSLGITFLQWLTNPNLSGPGNAALFAIMGAIPAHRTAVIGFSLGESQIAACAPVTSFHRQIFRLDRPSSARAPLCLRTIFGLPDYLISGRAPPPRLPCVG